MSSRKYTKKPQQKASSGTNEIFKQVCRCQCLFLTGEYCLGEVIFTNQWMIDARPMKDWCVKTQNTSALIESPGFPRIMGGEKNSCLWDSPCHPILQKFSNHSSYLFFFNADFSLMPPSRLSWSDKLCIHRELGRKSGWKQSSCEEGKQQSERNWQGKPELMVCTSAPLDWITDAIKIHSGALVYNQQSIT